MSSLPLLLLTLAVGVTPPAVEDHPAPGRYVWVDGHRLHLDCRGAGSPTVVFDAGLGGSSLDWALVQPAVATFTRACSYDRAGYAWSDPGPLPRDPTHIVHDLEQVLGYGSVAAPYVLVGHSLGGLIVQHFARLHPERTAALVLIDATHEDQFRRLEEVVLRSAGGRGARLVAGGLVAGPDGLPDDVQRLANAFRTRAHSIIAARSELTALRRAPRPASVPERMPDVPLVVISHRRKLPAASPRAEELEAIWMTLQRDLAALTPRSTHLIAATNDHYVHIREPETVIRAVRDLVEQCRHGGRPAQSGRAP
ncbi:MAG TPA: alpha/beta hydrolase [Pseudomonadales bacterium]